MVRKEAKHIDINNMPNLLRLAKEVKDTKEPIILRQDGEDLATLSPIRKRSRRTITEEDWEAFLSSFGSWKDVDTEALKRAIDESRSIPPRPLIEL